MAQSLIDAMRAGLSTPCVGETGCTRLAVAVHQPLNLTLGKIQLRGRIAATQAFFYNSLNDGKTVKFFVRHGHQHQQRSPRKGGKRAASG
ncbi:hypothetical protein NH00_23220 [Enterobacter cancerogenus]|nr:hypothetical protein NH00_23220 [Enterobacter cancerogenus]